MAKEFVKDRQIRCRGAARGHSGRRHPPVAVRSLERSGLAPVYSAEMITNRPLGPTPQGTEEPSVATYRLGDLLVDVGRGQVSRGKQDLALPNLSLSLLIALVR